MRSLTTMLVVIGLMSSACTSGSDSTSSLSPTSTSGSQATTSVADVTGTPVAGDLVIDIVAPQPLSIHFAITELSGGNLVAPVRLEARVEAPAGETVSIAWTSDIDGPLGVGSPLEAELSNGGSDVASHQITATATSSAGSQGSATIELIVQVPSN